MVRLLPWLIAVVCAAGWYLSTHPAQSPWSKLLTRVGATDTPREAMLRQWSSTGFDTTAYGQTWLSLGDSALRNPAPAQVPTATVAYFAEGQPNAVAIAFTLPRGRRLDWQRTDQLTGGPSLVELYEVGSLTDSLPTYLQSLQPGRDTLELDVDRDHQLVIRIEATPFSLGNVTLRLGSTPLLSAFPVSGASERDIGSRWGVDRDGGRRSHEGIDIFEARGTPLIAAGPGVVTRVRNGGLGGKQVWVRLAATPVSLYYAHLDSQYVVEGMLVRPGDTLGTVGNTGNARTTPPHLHFGIYGRGGAIDPSPFVAPAAVPDRSPKLRFTLAQGGRLRRDVGSGEGRLSAKQYVHPLALIDGSAVVRLADGRTLVVTGRVLESRTQRLSSLEVPEGTTLRAYDSPAAPAVAVLPTAVRVEVVANGTGEGRLVRTETGAKGWLTSS